jgi:hypothetical protein
LRDIKVFISDIFRKPPILFPLVAVFHVVWFFICLLSLVQQPGTSTYVGMLWMLVYSIFWIGVADQRKWAAMGYIGITVVDIIIWYMAYAHGTTSPYQSPLFLIDILFSFFIMFYFKRFR